jgi:predicted ester cyclase
MTIRQNKEAMLRMMEAFNNPPNPRVVDELIAPEYKENQQYPLAREMERLSAQQRIPREIEIVRAAFPDGKYTVRELVAERNRVVLIWDFTGTHTGDFFGRAATGRQLNVTGYEVVKFNNKGQMIGHFSNHGQTGMEVLAQVGFLDAATLEQMGMPQTPR